ncbi:MAG: acyl-CoA dehydrogenase family protein [Deltaproteobacteria bacterium]|nr:acyl-CoA dehydrogenase family protein [Deltaproteobacteria bacterium]
MLRSDFQKLMPKIIARFVKDEIEPLARRWDENREYPQENMRKLAEMRILGMRVPPKYGGSGRSLFDSVLILEQIAKADPSTAINLHIQHNASPIYVIHCSSDKVKEKFLIPFASGKILFSMAQTEPDVGSNLNDLSTTARRVGNDYIVNGAKCMITLGRNANVHLVYVKFEDDNSIGCLLIEKGQEGLYQGGHEDFLGLRGLDSGELVFNDCRVPEENLLIKGRGSLRQMLTFFNGTRVGLASISLGIAEAAFEEALRYSKIRTISRKPLIEYQGLQWKLADMAIKIEEMRQLVYSAAKDTSLNGFPNPFTSSAARIVASESAIEITNMVMSIFGAYGYSKEYPIERYLRDARGTTFIGGTPEVLRNAIGSYLKKRNL